MEKEIVLTTNQCKVIKLLKDKDIKVVKFNGRRCDGKTWLGLVWMFTECLHGEKKCFGLVADVAELRELIGCLKKALSHYGVENMGKYNMSQRVYKFHNGSVIYILDPKFSKVDEYYWRWSSFDFDGVVIDNPTPINSVAYKMLIRRTRKLYETKLTSFIRIDVIDYLGNKKSHPLSRSSFLPNMKYDRKRFF